MCSYDLKHKQNIKGALDNILKFSFWLNFIYQVKMTAFLQIQKENSKNSF